MGRWRVIVAGFSAFPDTL